ncbi:MAG: DUF5682 family protein [Cyanobacteria bacterium J06642_2]
MSVHIFGIRHHGPGSARSLRDAIAALQPNIILVEGPPDANDVIPLLAQEDMQPPVALLLYAQDDPQQAAYYPFACFSPEWQALHFGLSNNIPVQFMDLPQAMQLGLQRRSRENFEAALAELDDDTSDAQSEEQQDKEALLDPSDRETDYPIDPLGWLAEAAGYRDRELWWERMVEQRQDSTDLFAAILEAMTALRTEVQNTGFTGQSGERQQLEAYREAYMRKTIRAAQKAGHEAIAVVCGAWHGPALAKMPPAKQDNALLKGLPKVKVKATWVPWTYNRLAFRSGYGAGIESPGWYHHLWSARDRVGMRWLIRVARLLREQDIDASSASVIEAVRLADTLAALRGYATPGLLELNEATQTVLCFGNDLPLQLIREQLVISDRLGTVSDDTPTVPLQQDLAALQKRLRLKPQALDKTLGLDLRKPNDLERSHLLHRLNVLGIPWGSQRNDSGQGTFRESWQLQWQPEFVVRVIEMAVWGNTVELAAGAYLRHLADEAANLAHLTELLDRALYAELPQAIAHLMTRIQAEAAVATDIVHLMEALPPLANVLRYGTVRQIDPEAIAPIVDGLFARICVGLPLACSALDEEATETMSNHVDRVNRAISLLQKDEHYRTWHAVLLQVCDRDTTPGRLAGQGCRILLDASALEREEVARHMGLALSTATEPPEAAAWIEGFLAGSSLLLLHDDALWQTVDRWVTSLSTDTFTALLPLLRRTFSNFPAAERRQMGERVSREAGSVEAKQVPVGNFDRDRADTVLPAIAQLLGIPMPTP